MNPVIKIYSHIRSGTHYLGHLLGLNFYKGLDLSTNPGYWGHWADRQFGGGSEVGRLFGHHMGPPPGEGPGVYLVRDGRDVAVSLWRTRHFLRPDMHRMPFNQFLRTPLDWAWSPSVPLGRYKSRTVIDNWYEHVTTWAEYVEKNSNILMLSYRFVTRSPIPALYLLKKRFGLEWEDIDFTPVHRLVGISPNRGQCGGWRSLFFPDDLDYFYTIVPSKFRWLEEPDAEL